MHFPINAHIGSVEIESHAVFELLAYVVGYRYYLHLRRNTVDTLSSQQRLWVIIGGAAGAGIGSKLLGFMEHPQLWLLAQQHLYYSLTAKTIVGGLLGGILGVEFAKKCTGITRSTGDLFCFQIILGMAIGRIGCFMAGVEDATSGLPTDSFLGIDMGDGIPRHPTQLYDIVALLAMWRVLLVLKDKFVLKEGSLFKLFMVFYLTWRFAIEFIKPIEVVAPFGLSAIQLACLAGLLYYRQVFIRPRSLLKDENTWPAANISTSS